MLSDLVKEAISPLLVRMGWGGTLGDLILLQQMGWGGDFLKEFCKESHPMDAPFSSPSMRWCLGGRQQRPQAPGARQSLPFFSPVWWKPPATDGSDGRPFLAKEHHLVTIVLAMASNLLAMVSNQS